MQVTPLKANVWCGPPGPALIADNVFLSLGGAIGYAYDGTARPLALALLASGLACLALVLWSEKGRLFGPSDAEMGRS